MSVLRSMNHAVTAPKELAFVHEAIAIREDELVSFENSMSNEKIKLENISTRINILTCQYSSLKQVLDIHRRDLSARERGHSDLLNLKNTLCVDGGDFYANFMAGLPSLPDYSAKQKEDISIMSVQLEEIHSELHAKLNIKPIWQRNIEGMELYRQRILLTIRELKAVSNHPTKKVPTEVWIMIFRHRITEDIDDYIKHPGNRSYHSTVVSLGQVASIWRDIVHTNNDLWKDLVCGPGQMHTKSQVERWKHATSFSHQKLNFICNLQARPLPHYSEKASPLEQVVMSSDHSIHLLCAAKDETIEAVRMLPFKNQSSMTLEMNEAPTVGFLNALTQCFPAFSSLKIVHEGDFPALQPSLYGRSDPYVEALTLDLGNFTPFKIDYYCRESQVKEIHIVHNGVNSIIGRSWKCPFLKVVGITPPDTVWLKDYMLPALHRLILYGPKLHTIAAPSLIDLSHYSSFPNIKELEIRKWPVYEPADGESWNILPLVLAIADRLRFIETIRCIDSFIEGKSMVSLVKLLKATHVTLGPSKLKTVIIDCCSGITRDDCDFIASSVEKLEVYV